MQVKEYKHIYYNTNNFDFSDLNSSKGQTGQLGNFVETRLRGERFASPELKSRVYHWGTNSRGGGRILLERFVTPYRLPT